MKKVRFLMMAIAWAFVMCVPTQGIAQNKKLLKEAENGSGEAQALLATYYFNGTEGFEKDIEQAKFWAREAEKSARDGSWMAQAWLTARLFYGDQMYKRNVSLAKKWADATLNNPKLQGAERAAFMDYMKQIDAEFVKENPGSASSKPFRSMPQVGTNELPVPFTTEQLLDKIRTHVNSNELFEKYNMSLSTYANSNVMTYAFHRELLCFAQSFTLDGEKIKESNEEYGKKCLMGYYGIKQIAEQGNKEAQDFLNNPTQYFRRMDDNGRIYSLLKQSGKVDDFLAKFDADYVAEITKAKEDYEQKAKKDERDIVKFLYAGDEYLELGTVLHKKNGVLKINTTDYTGGNKDTFTMNDGSVYIGTFKGKESRANENTTVTPSLYSYDIGILDLDELIPDDGTIQYADGTTDYYSFGKSQRAENAAKEAEKAKEREAYKAGVAKILKDLQPELTRLGKKYGAANINSLKTTGRVKVGYSVAMISEYIKVYNKFKQATADLIFSRPILGSMRYFEPSVRDMLQYGKTAKRVQILIDGSLVFGRFMMANGKIAAIYEQTNISLVGG